MESVEPVNRPAILAVVEESGDLQRVEDELRRRYSADYDISCASSPAEAEIGLVERRAAGHQLPSF